MPGSNRVEKCDPVLILVALRIDRSCYKYREQDETHFPFWTSAADKLPAAVCRSDLLSTANELMRMSVRTWKHTLGIAT